MRAIITVTETSTRQIVVHAESLADVQLRVDQRSVDDGLRDLGLWVDMHGAVDRRYDWENATIKEMP